MLNILLTAQRTIRIATEPLLAGILAQYVPAGIKLSVRWRVVSAVIATMSDADGEVLDANGPGALGEDSFIGRTVLGGRASGRIDEAGLDLGFRLQ